MKYYQIEISCEPSIIGVNDASAQVEILTKPSRHSFASEQERQYFCDYVAKNEKNLERAYMDSYAAIDSSQTGTIRAYKTKKRVKEVDIMHYMVNVLGFDFVISKRLLDSIEKFKLPDYNKVRMEIEGFDTGYYLVGFPILSPRIFNFAKSIFYDSFSNKKKIFKNHEDYDKYNGFFRPRYHCVKKQPMHILPDQIIFMSVRNVQTF